MAVTLDALEAERRGGRPGGGGPGSGEPTGPGRRRLGLEQLVVAGGQLGAGLGNLGFTLVAARLLDPSGFARLSVFLGLYLVLSLPGTSLSAATALDPDRRDVLVRRVALATLGGGVLAAGLSPVIAPLLHLPVVMVLVLAASIPASGGLALERGRLYGLLDHRRVIASLLAEPLLRLSAGVALAAWSGAVGGAEGVVLGAYVALEIARPRDARARHRRRRRQLPLRVLDLSGIVEEIDTVEDIPPAPTLSGAGWTAAAFALLAVVQNQDLIFANALLPGSRAGLYAALSTLGGTAAFATITLPMVLLPRAAKGDRNSLGVAVGMAAVLGLVAVGVGAAASHLLITTLFGARYAPVTHLVALYLLAMALLGVARVLVADRCATSGARAASGLVAAAAVGQAVVNALVGRSVDRIAVVTLATTAALTVALGAERLVRRAPATAGRLRTATARAWARVRTDRAVHVLGAAMTAGLVMRLIVWRGLWLDEATSVHEVQMSYSGMLSSLRNTDVHPPLYFTVLWAFTHLFGYGSMVVRTPSIVAGLLVVPAAYLAARDLWDRRTGLVAACLASVAPMLVWYSQEVRMYSMFMLFAALALWGQARAMKRGGVGDWAIYALATAALAWTEYFGIFQVVAQQMYFLWHIARGRADRRQVHGYLAATAAIVALTLPLAPFAWHQFAVNQNAGKGFGAPSQTTLAGTESISVYTVLANLAWAVLGYHSAPIMEGLVALWPLGILVSLYVLGRKATRDTHLVLAAAVVPAALLLGAGMEKRFLYDVRYMSGVAVALLLLGARMITGGSRQRAFQVLGCLIAVAVLTAGLVDEQFNGTNPRLYDFDGALTAVNHQWQPGDVIVYEPQSIWVVVDYYAPHDLSEPVGSKPPAVPPGHRVFVLASKSLMSGDQPGQLGRLLANLGQAYMPGDVIRRSNVTVWSYTAPGGAG